MSTEIQKYEEPQGTQLLAIIERASKDATVNVENMERLFSLAERMEHRNAERSFNASFAKMQAELPTIVAETEIPNRGKYAKFENVMRQIQPMLTANGFSVSFNQAADEKRITVKCTLRHVAGHSSETSFSVRLGGRADSDTQADCKASTTAKRNALLQALNIVIRQDFYQSDEADATIEGGFITASQAADLRALCDETRTDHTKFLKLASADSFEKITTSRLADLTETLERRRK